MPTLTVDYASKKVIVTTAAATYVYNNRSEAYVDFPELAPAALTAQQERQAARREASERKAGGYGFSRSGRR